jgi:hypothetical protein
MSTRIDHLVIGARELAHGIAYVKAQLGVDMPFGGEHEKMGTHNHLMQLGSELFLEVIAINPEKQSPRRPRWFGLDDPHVRQTLNRQPALLTWVVNTHDINRLLQQASVPSGHAEPVSRGDLSWYFGIPEDGRLLAGGLLPYLMQWQVDRHPAKQMADRGCRLQALHLHHPSPEWLRAALESIHADSLVEIHPLDAQATPFLEAWIATPDGPRVLSSRTDL